MPHFICRYKNDDSEPRYFIWSTISDGPISKLMTREEVVEHQHYEHGHSEDEYPSGVYARLDRADKYGTSAYGGKEMGWDDSLFTQEGTGPRDSLHFDGDEYWYDPPLTPYEDD